MNFDSTCVRCQRGTLLLPRAIGRTMEAPILRLDEYERPGLQPKPRVTLEITRGKVQQRIRPIQGKVFLIGTASDCDLVLGDLSFPEVYAYLFVDASKIVIRRLGSGPALSISGERTDKAELFQGDEIRFGPFELRVVVSQGSLDDDADADESLWTEAGDDALPALLQFSPRENCTL
jgi:hypothetical protein